MTNIYHEVSPGFISTDIEVQEDYLNWLISLVSKDRDILVLKHLHTIPFTWLIPRDEARASDGVDLRLDYERLTRIPIDSYLESSASVLEVLIGIAYRVDDILWDGGEEGALVYPFFWQMLHNIGLDKMDNITYLSGGSDVVDEVVMDVMTRNYRRDGVGGLFPLQFPKKDQRKVEIFYQMHSYIQEERIC